MWISSEESPSPPLPTASYVYTKNNAPTGMFEPAGQVLTS
jgi:hypothetical protein